MQSTAKHLAGRRKFVLLCPLSSRLTPRLPNFWPYALTACCKCCLRPHSRKTIHRRVQVAREVCSGLRADAERGARVLFDREHRGERHFLQMLDEAADAGVQFAVWNDIAGESE